MQALSTILFVVGIGIVALKGSTILAYVFCENASKRKFTDEIFAIGCMLIAQYFV